MRLIVTARDGGIHAIPAESGRSIMEIIRDGGIDELIALCGGCLSCATCHIHVDQHWLDRLPAMAEDEDDLLDTSDHRDQTSRLACQIRFDAMLDGLSLSIASED